MVLTVTRSRIIEMVFIGPVVPLEFVAEKNLIVCKRIFDLHELKKQLRNDVVNENNEHHLELNVTHAMRKIDNSSWCRVNVKFFKDEFQSFFAIHFE